jgi:glucose dehydrogenase
VGAWPASLEPLRLLRWRAAFVPLPLAALVLSCGSGGGAPDGDAAPQNPLSTATTAADWPMYGHDTSRTNCSSGETALSAASVPSLAPAWQFDVGTSEMPTSSGPIVAAGRAYVGSGVASGDNYFALDAGSGQPLWSANLGHGRDLLASPAAAWAWARPPPSRAASSS